MQRHAHTCKRATSPFPSRMSRCPGSTDCTVFSSGAPMKIAGKNENAMCEAKTAIMKNERKLASGEPAAAREAIVLECRPGRSPESAPIRKPEKTANISTSQKPPLAKRYLFSLHEF